MKKFFKGLFLTSFVALALGLAACGGHKHEAKDEWSYSPSEHWHECKGSKCDESLDVAAHTWGEWKVTKEATLEEEGARERKCSVCSFTYKESIPKLVPEGFVEQYYVKGAMNGWGAEDDYKLVIADDKKSASIEVQIAAGVEFKVANADWTAEFNTETITDPDELTEGSGNIKMKESGTYKFVVTYGDEDSCTVSLVSLGEVDPVPAPEPDPTPVDPTEETVKYFAQVPSGWTNVNMHYWQDGGDNATAWPGRAMTKVAGNLWEIEVPTWATHVIVNNGTVQTKNAAVEADKNLIVLGAADAEDQGHLAFTWDAHTEEEPVVIYAQVPTDWTAAYMHFWQDGSELGTAWPGEAMEKVSEGLWKIELPTWATHVIVNNNNGTQTKNAEVEAGKDLLILGAADAEDQGHLAFSWDVKAE